jgi:hypothetical protein
MGLGGSYRTECFQYRGETWTRYLCPSKAELAFIMGVDLAQAVDYTAVAVLRHTRTPLPIDDAAIDRRARTIKQQVDDKFDVVYAERMPLGTAFPAVIAHVHKLLDRPPLCDGTTYLVVDETGVGAPVCDEFGDAGLKPVRVHITSGTAVTKLDGLNRWGVPKLVLTSCLDARLHTGELRFAAAMDVAPAIADEFKDFRRSLTAAGRATYQARSNKHDDLVLAIGIATWWAMERSKWWSVTGAVGGLW